MQTEIALLQNVRVASPCAASWDGMEQVDGDRVRYCEGCHKRVYNLSAMGQAAAEGLLRAHEGHLCVRYYRRHDGTILTSDCPVGLRAARTLVLQRARVSIGLCLLLCVAFAAHSGVHTQGRPAKEINVNSEVEPAPLMGNVAAPHREVVGEVAPPERLVMGKVALIPSSSAGYRQGRIASPRTGSR